MSVTRFSIVLVVVLQWLAVIIMVVFCRRHAVLFADFDITLPAITAVVLKLSQPLVLIPVAAAATLMLVASEALVKSEGARIITQTVYLSFWIVLAGVSITVIWLQFVDLLGKLT